MSLPLLAGHCPIVDLSLLTCPKEMLRKVVRSEWGVLHP